MLILGCRQCKVDGIPEHDVSQLISFIIIKRPSTASKGLVTRRGRRPLIRNPSFCWAAITMQRSSLPRFCEVLQSRIKTNNLCPGNESVASQWKLHHSGNAACGIPDGETIVMTGGYKYPNSHSFVTRCSWELGGAVCSHHL